MFSPFCLCYVCFNFSQKKIHSAKKGLNQIIHSGGRDGGVGKVGDFVFRVKIQQRICFWYSRNCWADIDPIPEKIRKIPLKMVGFCLFFFFFFFSVSAFVQPKHFYSKQGQSSIQVTYRKGSQLCSQGRLRVSRTTKIEIPLEDRHSSHLQVEKENTRNVLI